VRSPSVDVFEKVELQLIASQFESKIESFTHTLIVCFILIGEGALTNPTFFLLQ
jgi:hypothetical protein